MANYTMRADGTAANKAAAVDGDPAVIAECMNVSVHNGETFAAGDVIMFADTGGDYRDTVVPPSNGSLGSVITYEAYSGDTPIFNGSALVDDWTVYSGSVYQATVTTNPQQVFIDDTFGSRQASAVACVSEYDWFWESNVLYLYAPGDPDTEYTTPGVEACVHQYCFDMQGDYNTLDGVTARYTTRNGIGGFAPGSYVTIQNCLTEWNWYKGIGPESTVAAFDHWIIQDNISRYNGIGGIGMSSTNSYGIIRRNECYENGKYQSDPVSYDSEFAWTYGIKLFEISAGPKGNEIYENKSYSNGRGIAGDNGGRGNGIWIDHLAGDPADRTLVHHNLAYNNEGSGIFIEISSYTSVYCNVCYDNSKATNGEPGNIILDSREDFLTENNRIYNNTCSGGKYGLKVLTYGQTAGCSMSDNTFKNNIFVGNSDHNVWVNQGGDNNGTYGSGNLYSNNCFGAEATDFLKVYGTSYSTYDSWIAALNANEDIQPDNNIESDPSFFDDATGKYWLAAGSPCIGAGVEL